MTRGPHRALAAAINRALSLDPEAATVLEPLAGRSLAVLVEGMPALDTFVLFDRDRVVLEPAGPRADVTLSGTPSALLSLLTKADELPARARVTVQGNVGLLNAVRVAASRLRPDWAEPVARVLGDELGQPVTRGIAHLAGFAARTLRELKQDSEEFLREESGLLVGADEARAFSSDVDTVRDAVERLDKRIDRLGRRGRGT